MTSFPSDSSLVTHDQLSTSLDGGAGVNRAPKEARQIAADNDIEAIRLWLAEYAHSLHTLNSYRKEANRLLIWSTRWLGKPISSLKREDLVVYEAFLTNPPTDWSDPAMPRHGKQRRLFTGPLSANSVHQAIGILSNLFNYLVAAGYLLSNPLALRRRRRQRGAHKAPFERYLERPLWQFVLDFVDNLPQQTRREQQYYERVRWVFRLLYGTSLRVSEAAQAQASDLKQRRGRWWLYVQGKGGKEAYVPVSDALFADFSRYRQFHQLPPLPIASETKPLILSITGRSDQPLTSTALYLIVKKVFNDAAAALKTSNPADAAILQQASTHWLRHTSATHQADAGNDIRHIQKNLRHASIETTAIYLHAEDEQRHIETTSKLTFTDLALHKKNGGAV